MNPGSPVKFRCGIEFTGKPVTLIVGIGFWRFPFPFLDICFGRWCFVLGWI